MANSHSLTLIYSVFVIYSRFVITANILKIQMWNNHTDISIQTHKYSVLSWSAFFSDYSLKCFSVWCFLPLLSADRLTLCQAGHFQVSPEMSEFKSRLWIGYSRTFLFLTVWESLGGFSCVFSGEASVWPLRSVEWCSDGCPSVNFSLISTHDLWSSSGSRPPLFLSWLLSLAGRQL